MEESKRTSKNEIDYILPNKKNIVKNVEVIQRVNVGSDHRLVRGTTKTNTRTERCKMMRTRISKVNIEVLLLQEEFQVQLQNRFEVLSEEGEEDVGDMVSKITNAIRESALDTAGGHREQKNEKLKSKTKHMLKRRREIIERRIPRTHIEHADICKTVRKLSRDDIREYNTMRVKEAVETGKGLKKATTKEECKVMIPSLKEEDGSIITNRERILKRCAEFYEKLYEDTVQNIAKVSYQRFLPICACSV